MLFVKVEEIIINLEIEMSSAQRDHVFSGDGSENTPGKPDYEMKYNAPKIYEINTSGCDDDGKVGNQEWSREALYRVVLSELGKFPKIDEQLFTDLTRAAKLTPGKHLEGKDIFCRLLCCENIGFTVATAIFKFLNPEVFQVLNSHCGQIVMGDSLPPSRFSMEDYESYADAASEYYFRYLDKLRDLTRGNVEFRNADALLGQVDKLLNC